MRLLTLFLRLGKYPGKKQAEPPDKERHPGRHSHCFLFFLENSKFPNNDHTPQHSCHIVANLSDTGGLPHIEGRICAVQIVSLCAYLRTIRYVCVELCSFYVHTKTRHTAQNGARGSHLGAVTPLHPSTADWSRIYLVPGTRNNRHGNDYTRDNIQTWGLDVEVTRKQQKRSSAKIRSAWETPPSPSLPPLAPPPSPHTLPGSCPQRATTTAHTYMAAVYRGPLSTSMLFNTHIYGSIYYSYYSSHVQD